MDSHYGGGQCHPVLWGIVDEMFCKGPLMIKIIIMIKLVDDDITHSFDDAKNNIVVNRITITEII